MKNGVARATLSVDAVQTMLNAGMWPAPRN